ncbi:MAG: helix-turn-helix domain-containing protein [Actinomycetota bacterium]|nr:helix-turn-helix domain-containing protein [Actinomycetota bacterium]
MGGRVGAREHDAFRLGQELRAGRERIGWDLRAASAATAIPAAYLHALEEGQLSALPGPVYARGYVRTYATALHLDGDAFTYAFCRLQPQGRFDRLGPASPSSPRSPSRAPPRRWTRVLGIVLLAFLGLLVVNAVWAAVGPDQRDEATLDLPPSQSAPGSAPSPPVSAAPAAPPGPLAATSSDSEGAAYAVGRDTFTVGLEATGRVWVQVRPTDDGDVMFEETLVGGDIKSFPAAGQLWIRVGNQGNVKLSVDGTPLTFPQNTDEPYNIDLRK